MRRVFQRTNFKLLDPYILFPFFVMCVIGIVMVYSASSDIAVQNGGSPSAYLGRQSVFVVLGIITMFLVFGINIKKLTNGKLLAFTYIAFFIIFVILKFTGKTINGSTGWFRIGSFGIQPSEFVKFYFILAYATYASNKKTQIEDRWWHANLPFFVFEMFICLLIFFQPDLGGAAINWFIVTIMAYSMVRNKFRAIAYSCLILILILLALDIVPVLVNHGFLTTNYQIQRIIAFSSPFQHAQSSGQQLVNSYYAFSNGGLFGVGLGNSIQKMGYLPEPNTDFIIAIISEELGAVAVIFILVLLLIIIWRVIMIGINSNNTLDTLICYGTAAFFLVESFFNIGGVIGLLPITGVTFPFISYGGSSMITLCACLGVVLKISYNQAKAKRGENQ